MLIPRHLLYLSAALTTPRLSVSSGEVEKDYQSSFGSTRSRDQCNDRTVDSVPSCWDALGISQYLETWWAQHKLECNSSLYNGSGFVSCYQQKLQILEFPCDEISTTLCYRPSFSDNPNITITEYYVLYSISNIWAWYNNLWHSVEDATLLAHLQAGVIVDTIRNDMPHDEPLPGVIPCQLYTFSLPLLLLISILTIIHTAYLSHLQYYDPV